MEVGGAATDGSAISVGRAIGTSLTQTTLAEGTVSPPVLAVGPKDGLFLGWHQWDGGQRFTHSIVTG